MKNYTSQVAPDVTITRIEQTLVRFGASNISKDYVNGEVAGITFSLTVATVPEPLLVRLPADAAAVYNVLRAGKKRRSGRLDHWQARLQEQSKRTAWKLVQDWLEVQLALVEMRQAEAAQVFMPYFWNGGTTLFQLLKATQFAALTYKPESPDGSEELEGEEA